MDIRPIRTGKDHAAALTEIGRLWGAAPDSEDGDRLDLLTLMVERYEERRWPIADTSDPIDILRFAIDDLGHTQAELGALIGSRSRASEILARRRALTVAMIRKISQTWRIPADLLVRPYRREAA